MLFLDCTLSCDIYIYLSVYNQQYIIVYIILILIGPVLCIREFTTEDEAVTEANNTVYGLAGAVFSADLIRCERVSRNLRAGVVWKNCCQPAFIQVIIISFFVFVYEYSININIHI